TLARWTDRDLGPVSPVVFIPIAEERGIIGPMSQLVLRKATEAARDWPKDLFLSFNLSPSQLVDQNTGLHILAILDRTGFDPRRLEIEITETGLMSDPASAEKIIEDLRRCGIRVSLDDFGTGQSSLGRLREFQFDKLKIDRAFIASLLDDRPSEHIIRAILAMCEGLGMDVVAEGIEEEEQAERLVQFGCGGGQGFLIGRPANADATLGYLPHSFRAPQRTRASSPASGSGAFSAFLPVAQATPLVWIYAIPDANPCAFCRSCSSGSGLLRAWIADSSIRSRMADRAEQNTGNDVLHAVPGRAGD